MKAQCTTIKSMKFAISLLFPLQSRFFLPLSRVQRLFASSSGLYSTFASRARARGYNYTTLYIQL